MVDSECCKPHCLSYPSSPSLALRRVPGFGPLKGLRSAKSQPSPVIDPISAIGAASAVLSFVDTAAKVLRLAWELYDSVEGTYEENRMRDVVAGAMKDLSTELVLPNQSNLTGQEKQLSNLAKECQQLSNDIQEEVKKLKPKHRKSKVQSLFLSTKIIFGSGKLKNLDQRLGRCRAQLEIQINAMSRSDHSQACSLV